MSRFLRIIPHIVSVLLLSSWCVQGLLRVSVSPRLPLFPLGGRGQLVCSVQDCPWTPSIAWSLLEDRPLTASISANSTHSTVTFDPVAREHEGALLCKASCGRDTRQAVSSVHVYSFPSAPVIRGNTRVPLGLESGLVCEVQDLYPAELLTLDWIQGDQVLQSVTGDSGSNRVRSQLQFTPQRPDSEADFSCRATLDLTQLTPDLKTRETRVRLDLLCESRERPGEPTC